MPSVLQFDSVTKSIGDLILFENASFILNKEEKAALLGPNGAGKSTLLELVAGIQSQDKGDIIIPGNPAIAYLPQEPVLPENESVINSLFSNKNAYLQPVRNYEEALISGDAKRIEQTVLEMDRQKLWDVENRMQQILTQLSITNFDQKIEELSGGQRKRVALAGTLLSGADLLILDEPTNHLDLNAIEWLEHYLMQSSQTLLMVTHDRYFLDRMCNTIFEIDNKQLYRYEGNYSRFANEREKRLELEELEVQKAQNLLRKEEDWMSRMPKARGTKAKYRISNYYALKKTAGKHHTDKQMQLSVSAPRMGTKIVVAKNIDFRWNNRYYIKDFSYIFNRYEKTGIIGNNGSGKSTLIEILTGNLKPEKGILETGETIKIGYFRQEGLKFDEQMKVLDAVTKIAETITIKENYTLTASQFLNYFLFHPARQQDQIYKLSGGEKRRLYLCQVLMQKPNFLILDEPTNDLDIVSLQILEEFLSTFNGCVLFVTHDRYFLDRIADNLFVFSGDGNIKNFPGNYSGYSEWKKGLAGSQKTVSAKKEVPKPVNKPAKNKLSYREKQELEQLENEISILEDEKSTLEFQLVNKQLSPEELVKKSERIGIVLKEIDAKTNRWLALSEKA